MKYELENKVLVSIKKELDTGDISGDFDEKIEQKVRRNGQRRRALKGIGVLLMVFGTAIWVSSEGDLNSTREPLPMSQTFESLQADDARLAEEWWEEDWAVTEDDEAYTEEFQALALLLIDPMYRDVEQLRKGE